MLKLSLSHRGLLGDSRHLSALRMTTWRSFSLSTCLVLMPVIIADYSPPRYSNIPKFGLFGSGICSISMGPLHLPVIL
ncbi:hypothetical protein ASPSYDRAFT_464717 [Aspergillus sydowii CBS 593.65]|uniref:Uncharacterized protein n=1 Tax=Aspergillus sydowii CBS 593.65 TaxID=1036612 RepID=A0A1L9T4Q6_9EURO|nr:uncharacterized protein ASPSYDRAFT_464717 [Aspergillus sydowii CBS 593.65]OJJ54409.1 hypothetical protein ASPSYDRAFT_464717 [Aspergillus sydowii CBS 593.65]